MTQPQYSIFSTNLCGFKKYLQIRRKEISNSWCKLSVHKDDNLKNHSYIIIKFIIKSQNGATK